MAGNLFLVRHAESTANAGLPSNDPTKIPLSPWGYEHAEKIAASWAIKPSLIVTSPYTRARETAFPLRNRFPDVPTETWAVQEYVFFNLIGKPTTAADRKPMVDLFWERSDPLEKKGPNTETFSEFWSRVAAFNERVERFSGEHLVVFTHGFFLRAFEYGRRHGFGPCSHDLMRAVYQSVSPDHYPNGCVIRHPCVSSSVLVEGHRIDIAYDAAYPGGALSNFSERSVEFDGVTCNVEGLLQSLKFGDVVQQQAVCKLGGREAKAIGATRNDIWQSTQTLWWKGRPMSRQGKDYQMFLDKVYQTVADQCEDFREALLATGDADLTHSIGSSDPVTTVLTSQEFCSRLLKLRKALRDR